MQLAVLGPGDTEMHKANKTFPLVDLHYIEGADRKLTNIKYHVLYGDESVEKNV